MPRQSKITANLESLREDFDKLRDPQIGKKRIKASLKKQEEHLGIYLENWLSLSRESDHVYPSQGLLFTPYDHLAFSSLQMLPQEMLVKTLRLRRFFLELFNHPYRIQSLKTVNSEKFKQAPKVISPIFTHAEKVGLSISIGDLGSNVVGSNKPRVSRGQRYAHGPFVKLGKQARNFFLGSSSPDVWNSAPAIATMAASHCIAIIPRNGVTADIKRQTDLAKEVFEWLTLMESEILTGRDDKELVAGYWRNNVMGTLEANPKKVLYRAHSLFDAGVKSFRVYSPEPGDGVLETVKLLRKEFKSAIEIFAGQIIDVNQAKAVEDAGADALVVGIGGGGRCITGIRSVSVINWPSIIWNLRGQTKLPVIADGGATDYVATTLLLGASGLMTSRAVAGGTLESPGGALFCSDGNGRLFKPYGGEASARTKYLDGKLLPFNIPSFVEGETTKAEMSYVKHALPTLTYNLHYLIEDSILALVFRNVETIHDLHSISPSPLRRSSASDQFQRSTH